MPSHFQTQHIVWVLYCMINAEDGLLSKSSTVSIIKGLILGGGDQTTSSTHQRTCRNYYNLCGPNYTNAMKMSKKDKNQSPQRCFANSGRPNLEFERFEGFCFGLRNTYWRILLIVFLYQKYSFLNKQLLIINKSSSQCGLSL